MELTDEAILTSTMDCCAPAGSYTANTHHNANIEGGFMDGLKRIIPCQIDGYTPSTL